MRIDLFPSILQSTLVLLVLGTVHLFGAATVDDPATMLRSAIDDILTIAYSGHSNESLPARVRPSLEKSFALDLVTRQAAQLSAGCSRSA